MMKSEFEELAGVKTTDEQYQMVIEPMYLATSLTKQEFVKLINVKAIATTEIKPKNIKRMLTRDYSGYTKTPNGCYYHVEYVELINVRITDKKYIVKALSNEEKQKLSDEGKDLNLAYSYDFDFLDCVNTRGEPICLYPYGNL